MRRDVDRLRELGYRIRAIKGPDGGYRLDAGSELPPLLFDDEQAVALAVALQSLVAPGLDEAAARALATVRQVMPARLRGRIDAVRVTAMGDAVAVDPAALVSIGEAIRASEVLRFDYADEPRRAEPHHLVARSGRWYLVAWDLDRDDWRTFRVDRLALRSHTGARFTPRELPSDVPTFVASRFKGSTTDAWPCEGTAIIALPLREVAPYVGDGSAEEVEGGTRVTLGSWSWMGLAASLARFDADLHAVEPAELREAFGNLSRRFLVV